MYSVHVYISLKSNRLSYLHVCTVVVAKEYTKYGAVPLLRSHNKCTIIGAINTHIHMYGQGILSLSVYINTVFYMHYSISLFLSSSLSLPPSHHRMPLLLSHPLTLMMRPLRGPPLRDQLLPPLRVCPRLLMVWLQ